MRKTIPGSCLLLGVLLLAPAAAEAQNNKGNKGNKNNPNNPIATVASDKDYAALAQMAAQSKQLVGKVTSIEPTTKLVGIHVEYQKMQLKANSKLGSGSNPLTPQQQKQLQQLQHQMQQQMQQHPHYSSSRGGRGGRGGSNQAAQQMQHQMHIQQIQAQYQMKAQQIVGNAIASNYEVVTASIDFELVPTDNVRVVLTKLPSEYDDKGQVITHSKEELKKRHDKYITSGYTGKWEDLQEGQMVKLYLTVPKTSKKKDAKSTTTTKSAAGAKDVQAEKDAPAAKDAPVADAKDAKGLGLADGAPAAEDHPDRPRIRQILIAVEDEPNPLAPSATPPQNNKKIQ